MVSCWKVKNPKGQGGSCPQILGVWFLWKRRIYVTECAAFCSLALPLRCQHVLAGRCCSHFLTAHLGLVPAEPRLRYPGGGAVNCIHHTCPHFIAYGDLCFSVFPWWNVCFQGSQQPACADKLNWDLSREALSRSAAGCVTAQSPLQTSLAVAFPTCIRGSIRSLVFEQSSYKFF